MWQTITALAGARGRHITFGATVIYCDASGACSVREDTSLAEHASPDPSAGPAHG
jgi:hypothetical protein